MEYKNITFKWELSSNEKYIIDYLLNNNYEILSSRQYISKMVLVVKKNNLTTIFDIPYNIKDIEKYCMLLEKQFNMEENYYNKLGGIM